MVMPTAAYAIGACRRQLEKMAKTYHVVLVAYPELVCLDDGWRWQPWVVPVSAAIVMGSYRGCRTRCRPRPWRREWLRPFRRRASAHFHCPRLPKGCAHHSVGRSHRQSDGRTKLPFRRLFRGLARHKNRPYHRPSDAYRSPVRSGGGAVGRHRGRTGQPGRAVRSEGDCTPTWICSRQARIGRPENDGDFYLEKVLYSVKNCGISSYYTKQCALKERSTVQ